MLASLTSMDFESQIRPKGNPSRFNQILIRSSRQSRLPNILANRPPADRQLPCNRMNAFALLM